MLVLKCLIMYLLMGTIIFWCVHKDFEYMVQKTLDEDPRLRNDEGMQKVWLTSFVSFMILAWPLFAWTILTKFICKLIDALKGGRK